MSTQDGIEGEERKFKRLEKKEVWKEIGSVIEIEERVEGGRDLERHGNKFLSS